MPENMPKLSSLLYQIVFSVLIVSLACTNTSFFTSTRLQKSKSVQVQKFNLTLTSSAALLLCVYREE